MNRFKILDYFSNSNICKWIESFKESEKWDSDQINNYQNIQLKRLLNHAFNNTQYYLNYDIDIREIDLNDLSLLPIIRRQDIVNNLKSMKSSNIKKYSPMLRSTGGTTGVPLKYFSDKNSWSLGWALKYRDWSYGNYKIGNKMAFLAGASLIPNQGVDIKRKIWNYINGFVPLSTTHYNNTILEEYFNIIKQKEINFLRGYPTSILSFAEYIKKNNKKLNIKSIFTTAEVLQSEHKIFIEDIFNCKVFDQYGCADAGAHASQCDFSKGYHVSFESSICEIVNIEKNYDGKKIGELVYTNLTNYAMPTIRYAPGDFAEITDQGQCDCGRNTLKINKIIGRTTERIRFSNGNILAGPAFTLIFRKFNLIKYQLVQNDPNSLDVNLVVNKQFKINEEKQIIETLKYHCGNDVDISLNYLKQIDTPQSAKHKFIISNVI